VGLHPNIFWRDSSPTHHTLTLRPFATMGKIPTAKSLHNKSESFDPFVVIPDKVHDSTASPTKVAMADDDEALWELDEETLESGAVG